MGVDAVLKLREMGHGRDVAGRPIRAVNAKCSPNSLFLPGSCVFLKVIL